MNDNSKKNVAIEEQTPVELDEVELASVNGGFPGFTFIKVPVFLPTLPVFGIECW